MNGIPQEYIEQVAQWILDDITTFKVNGQDVGIAEVSKEGTNVTVVSNPQFYSQNITSIQILSADNIHVVNKTLNLEITPNEKVSFTEVIEIDFKGSGN